VLDTILRASLCIECIARQAALSPDEVTRCLARIAELVQTTAKEVQCDECRESRALYTVR
jgi:hypothetical protein